MIKSSIICIMKFVIIISCIWCNHVHGQNNIYVRNNFNDLYLVDIENCSATLIGSSATTLTDIAFNPVNNMLYGIIFSRLYSIDINTAATTLIGNGNSNGDGPINLNALTFSSNGTLYAMGPLNDTLYTIDIGSGAITSAISTNTGLTSSGDIEFFHDTLFMVSMQNSLVAIDVITPTNSSIIGSFPIPLSRFGMATTLCPNYLYITDGASNIYKQSPFDLLQSTLQCSNIIPGSISGAAAAHNIYIPADSVYTNGCLLSNDTALCNGQQLTLDVTTFGATYLWQNGNTNPFNTITVGGIYWAQISVNGCFTTDSILVSYYTKTPEVNFGNDTTLCSNSSLELFASGASASYLWQDNSTDSIYSVTSQGIYWVEATNNCGSVIDSIEVNYIVVNVNVSDSNTFLIASAVGVNYQWLNCPGMTPINGATNQSYKAVVNGDYAVIVTNNGCTDTSVCYTVATVGIDENSLSNTSLYPNPTTGFINIDLEETKSYINLRLTNAVGQVILTKNYKSTNHINFDLEVPKGVYFLQIKTSNGELITRKIIKE